MARLLTRLVICSSLALLAGCQSGDGDAGETQCAQLVDHLVDLELGTSSPNSPSSAELEKHRAAMHRAIEKEVLADCLSQPVARAECALRASTNADLARCR